MTASKTANWKMATSLQQGRRRINAEFATIRYKARHAEINCQIAGNKKATQGSLFCCFKEFKGLEALYGAADGTRTRDPRRDRPVF